MTMVELADAELMFNGDGRACRCGANFQWRWSSLPMRCYFSMAMVGLADAELIFNGDGRAC